MNIKIYDILFKKFEAVLYATDDGIGAETSSYCQ